MSTSATASRHKIVLPKGPLRVEDGPPPLSPHGRTGQSKYSILMGQAKALKTGQHIKVPTAGVPVSAVLRCLRLAMKKADAKGVKVSGGADDAFVVIYRAN